MHILAVGRHGIPVLESKLTIIVAAIYFLFSSKAGMDELFLFLTHCAFLDFSLLVVSARKTKLGLKVVAQHAVLSIRIRSAHQPKHRR
jgi:hypothetical protein